MGHKCTYQGRLPDDSKISKLVKWPSPRNVTEVRGFLGVLAVLRIWIKDFAKHAKPLYALTEKNAEFEWKDEHEHAMNVLKELAINAPCIRPLDYGSKREVIVAVDSSKYAVGWVLLQIDQNKRRAPSRFGSLTFNLRERHYSQPKLELYGLFRALKAVRVYIIGVENLVVEVDAKYIKGMLNSPDTVPNSTLNRWVEGCLTVPFTLRHVPAKQHSAADGLSRRPRAEDDTEEEESDDERDVPGERPMVRFENCDDLPDTPISPEKPNRVEAQDVEEEGSALVSWIQIGKETLTERRTDSPGQKYDALLKTKSHPLKIHPGSITTPKQQSKWTRIVEDEEKKHYPRVCAFLLTLKRPDDILASDMGKFARLVANFFLYNGRLYRRASNGAHQQVMKRSDRAEILASLHDRLGHKGTLATIRAVTQRYWWSGVQSDVDIWIRSCHSCQLRRERKTRVPVQPSAPTQIFRYFHMDIMRMPSSRGFKYIVLARDDATDWPEGKALRKATSQAIATFLLENIISRWGAIEILVTDNGPENIGEAVQILLRRHGIQHIKISPYNSRANGAVERGHRTFRENIIRSCEGNPLLWPDMVFPALMAERATIRTSTGYSPFFLAHGYHPLLPTDAYFLTFGWDAKPMTQDELLVERTKILAQKPEHEEEALKRLKAARFKSAEAWNKAHSHTLRHEDFNPGDLVLVRNSAIETEHSRKHKPRWLGPMVIVRRTRGGCYVLAELSGAISKLRFAATRLAEYYRREGLSFVIEDFIPASTLEMLDKTLKEEERNHVPNERNDAEEPDEEETRAPSNEPSPDDTKSDLFPDSGDPSTTASTFQMTDRGVSFPIGTSPRTPADVLVRVTIETLQNVALKIETHVFANAISFPGSVRRIWWYVDAPHCALAYMSELGPGQGKGQVTPQTNLALDYFNAGWTPHDIAFPILSLCPLQYSLSYNQLLDAFALDLSYKRSLISLSPATILKFPTYQTSQNLLLSA